MSCKCSFLLLFLGVVVLTTPSIALNERKSPSEEYKLPAEALMLEEEVLENAHKPKCPPKHKPPTEAPAPSPKHHHHPHPKAPAEPPKMEEEALDNNMMVKPKCPPKHKPPTGAPAPSPKHHHHHAHHKPPTGASSPLPKHHHRKVSPSPAPAEDLEQPIMDWQ